MKNVVIAVVLIAVLAAAGYLGIPVLIEKKTGGMRSEVQDLKQRIQKIEEESKAAPLKPDSDVQKIIKTINALYLKVNSVESSFKKDLSMTNEEIKKHVKTTEESLNKQTEAIKNQKAATEEAFKKQAESIDKLNKEIQTQIQKLKFDAAMANIRGHIAKVRTDLLSKNISTAKTDMEFIDGIFETLKTSASDEKRKVIEDLRATLKKARAEIDNDLPAAINRIDLLWHEISKLLRRSS